MDQHAYEGLINQFEAEAANKPVIFQTKVLLISCVAYIVLIGICIGAALLIYFGYHYVGLFVIGLFTLAIFPVFLAVFRIIFMHLDPPDGRPIKQEEAPELFKVLDAMRLKLGGPPIHQVLIDNQFNAAISQIPRWGLFGNHTNYLILGLPYLLGMTEKEMLATIAHEYGHLCGNHGKYSAWVYRQRRAFGLLHEQVSSGAEDSAVHAILAGLLNFFAPYYNAYTFVLARQNEYEADRAATDMVGATANASGLIRGELLGRWVQDNFWPTIYKQADNSSQPLFMPYATMKRAFSISYDQWATQDQLSSLWREKSDLHDTHPRLRDRVEATGQTCTVPACVEICAAETLLNPGTKKIIEEFDQTWWQKEKKDWEARHRYVTRSKIRLVELSTQSIGNLTLPDLQELALLKGEFESRQAAKPVLEHLLKQPGGPFPKADYLYGRLLLEEGDDRGLGHLALAAKTDKTLFESSTRTGYYYLLNKHGEQDAETWLEKNFPDPKEHE